MVPDGSMPAIFPKEEEKIFSRCCRMRLIQLTDRNA
jgi:hypothetical protein